MFVDLRSFETFNCFVMGSVRFVKFLELFLDYLLLIYEISVSFDDA